MDPLINPPNIVVNGIMDITLEQNVGPLWPLRQVHPQLHI